jgi:hypothetical protein
MWAERATAMDSLKSEPPGEPFCRLSVEGCEETADLWLVELGLANELNPAVLCDIGDAALEEGWVDTKDGGRAGEFSRDPGRFQESCGEKGRATWKQMEEATAGAMH